MPLELARLTLMASICQPSLNIPKQVYKHAHLEPFSFPPHLPSSALQSHNDDHSRVYLIQQQEKGNVGIMDYPTAAMLILPQDSMIIHCRPSSGIIIHALLPRFFMPALRKTADINLFLWSIFFIVKSSFYSSDCLPSFNAIFEDIIMHDQQSRG